MVTQEEECNSERNPIQARTGVCPESAPVSAVQAHSADKTRHDLQEMA